MIFKIVINLNCLQCKMGKLFMCMVILLYDLYYVIIYFI